MASFPPLPFKTLVVFVYGDPHFLIERDEGEPFLVTFLSLKLHPLLSFVDNRNEARG